MRLFRWANEVLFRVGRNRSAEVAPPDAMYGSPTLFRPRLGQGAFRVRVTDIYYDLAGREIAVPSDPSNRPSRDSLEWHRREVFRS